LIILPPERRKLQFYSFGIGISPTVQIHGKLMKSLLLWAMVLMSLSGCSQDQHDHPNLTTGEQQFNYHCAECHGVQGTGKLFDGIPANILTQKSHQEIINYITTETGHERDMPVFTAMPLDEAKAITDHLLTLKESFDKNGSQIKQLLIEP
jgi:mono/diheme cytochrome c family protein